MAHVNAAGLTNTANLSATGLGRSGTLTDDEKRRMNGRLLTRLADVKSTSRNIRASLMAFSGNVDLSNTPLSPEQIKALATSLKELNQPPSAVVHLSLSGCGLTDASAADIATLLSAPSLKEVNLTNNPLGDASTAAIKSALDANKDLKVDFPGAAATAAATPTLALSNVRTTPLGFEHAGNKIKLTGSFSDLLIHLPHLAGITEVDCSDFLLNADQMRDLSAVLTQASGVKVVRLTLPGGYVPVVKALAEPCSTHSEIFFFVNGNKVIDKTRLAEHVRIYARGATVGVNEQCCPAVTSASRGWAQTGKNRISLQQAARLVGAAEADANKFSSTLGSPATARQFELLLCVEGAPFHVAENGSVICKGPVSADQVLAFCTEMVDASGSCGSLLGVVPKVLLAAAQMFAASPEADKGAKVAQMIERLLVVLQNSPHLVTAELAQLAGALAGSAADFIATGVQAALIVRFRDHRVHPDITSKFAAAMVAAGKQGLGASAVLGVSDAVHFWGDMSSRTFANSNTATSSASTMAVAPTITEPEAQPGVAHIGSGMIQTGTLNQFLDALSELPANTTRAATHGTLAPDQVSRIAHKLRGAAQINRLKVDLPGASYPEMISSLEILFGVDSLASIVVNGKELSKARFFEHVDLLKQGAAIPLDEQPPVSSSNPVDDNGLVHTNDLHLVTTTTATVAATTTVTATATTAAATLTASSAASGLFMLMGNGFPSEFAKLLASSPATTMAACVALFDGKLQFANGQAQCQAGIGDADVTNALTFMTAAFKQLSSLASPEEMAQSTDILARICASIIESYSVSTAPSGAMKPLLAAIVSRFVKLLRVSPDGGLAFPDDLLEKVGAGAKKAGSRATADLQALDDLRTRKEERAPLGLSALTASAMDRDLSASAFGSSTSTMLSASLVAANDAQTWMSAHGIPQATAQTFAQNERLAAISFNNYFGGANPKFVSANGTIVCAPGFTIGQAHEIESLCNKLVAAREPQLTEFAAKIYASVILAMRGESTQPWGTPTLMTRNFVALVEGGALPGISIDLKRQVATIALTKADTEGFTPKLRDDLSKFLT